MLNTDNKLYCGDNLKIMYGMPDESIDLIYLDPPFFSGKNYEVIWGDKAEIRSFDDRFEGGIMVYVEWMKDRLKEMHRILKPTGSIYLHVDHHAVHYLKVEMDKIFGNGDLNKGISHFVTQITWRRCGSKGNSKTFANNSDYILFYSKNIMKTTFNIQYGEYNNATLKMQKFDDNDGRGSYGSDNLSSPGGNGYKYDLDLGEKQPSGGYRWKKETMLQKIKDGMVIIKHGRVPRQKRYFSDCQGVPFDNVWTDIENVKSPIYPTQKPEALLNRIILASSNPGDIVFDPFCGCGTSAVTSINLKRNFIGIDISPIACKLIIERLKGNVDDIIGLPRNPKEIKVMEPHEFQNWVCQRMSARNTSPNSNTASGADGGVDGIIQAPLTNPKYHGAPIQVKRELSKSVGINTVKNFFATMDDLGKEIGFIVAISFGKGAKEQVAKYRNKGKVIIHLLTVEDIIDKDLNDITSKLKE